MIVSLVARVECDGYPLQNVMLSKGYSENGTLPVFSAMDGRIFVAFWDLEKQASSCFFLWMQDISVFT